MTAKVEAPPEFQMSDAVAKRYLQFMQDNHGEVDLPRLCEVLWNAGARNAVASMMAFSDIMPQLGRIENKIASIRQLMEAISSDDGGVS